MLDRVTRRVLGAIRLVDEATGVPITRGLKIASPGLTLHRTRSSLYVIMDAEGLRHHLTEFLAPPAAPAVEALNFTLTITDPSGEFAPRIAEIELPRAFDPASGVRDLQTPIDIDMSSGSARVTNPSWAVADVLVIDQNDDAIRGALIEVLPEGGGARLTWGITNRNGEARLPVTGLRPFQVNLGNPANPNDDTIATNVTRTDLRTTVDPNAPWPPNPDDLAGNDPAFRRTTLSPISLTPGRASSATVTLDLS